MIAKVSTGVKQVVAFLLYRSGLLRLWTRSKLGRRPLVVMYHRVLDSSDTDFSQDGIVVQAATFERQLLLLSRMFSIVSLADAARPEGAAFRCAITFDDGWADNHRAAFPILKRLGFPATLFITTGYIGTQRLFWPERLAFILSGLKPGEQLEELSQGLPDIAAQHLRALTQSAGRIRLDPLIESLKDVDEKTREGFLARLAQSLKCAAAPSGTRMLNWDEVRDLHRQGFEIGSHTVNHVILTLANPEGVSEELVQSRDQIASQLGVPPQSFAYPNGNWNPGLSAEVGHAGYRRAVTVDPPWRIPEGLHSGFAIPRKNLCENSSRGLFGFSESVFACEAVGFFDWCRSLWMRP